MQDKSLDHLIYDGMGQVTDNRGVQTIHGSVRPTTKEFKMNTTRITKLECLHGMWFWTETNDDESRNYRTSQNGEGLWIQKSEVEWKQVLGLSQFSLNGKSKSAVRSYLRRCLNN